VVPWRSLSSSPVEVILDSVYLVVCNPFSKLQIAPQEKSEWEPLESSLTNFELRDEMIQQFALDLY